jgi:hypothetical protein
MAYDLTSVYDLTRDSWDMWGASCIFAIYFSSLRFDVSDESDHTITFIAISMIIAVGLYTYTDNHDFEVCDRIANIYSTWYFF